MKNVFSIAGCREQGDELSVPAFGILPAKWRLLNKAIETNVSKAERTLSCICLLHNVIIDLEGTTHDHFVLQATLQIRISPHAKTSVSVRSFSRSSNGLSLWPWNWTFQ